MSSLLSTGFSSPPQGKRSLAAQLSFCFVVTVVILFVVSLLITKTYVGVLEKERAEAMKAIAVSAGLNLSGTAIQEGMIYPLPTYEHKKDEPYIVNIYLSAGSSFIRVYTSDEKKSSEDDNDRQYILDDAGSEYKKAFNQMTVELSLRTEDKITYRTAVAPIVGTAGAASGIIEVMMKDTDFHGTVNGFSLSWIFTILSIALSITIVYHQTHKMLITVFASPDRHLPKVIRYGLAGCETIAFFSAMACVIPPLIISRFITRSEMFIEYPDYIQQAAIAVSVAFFAVGFLGFRSFRVRLFNRMTARVALVASVVASFLLLLLNGVLSHPIVFILLQLPTAFGLGMLFFFQREYRMYAGRLGHEGFDVRTIQKKQFSSHVLGASVGAVMAGIVFDRFGLLAVLLICGLFLFIVTILSMLFIQHCPSSNEPSLHYATLLYAMLNRKSGTFLISTILTAGMQLSFFIGFMPNYLGTVGISVATVSFYYMIFAAFCCVLIRVIVSLSGRKITMISSVWLSALLQLIGYVLFAIMPTAKILVLSVALFGSAMGLNEFNFSEYYSSMIREEKRSIAVIILERAFANGVIISSVLLTVVLMFKDIRIPLIVYCFISVALLFAYPLMSLIHIQSSPVEQTSSDDPFAEAGENWNNEDSSEDNDFREYTFLRNQGLVAPWEDEEDLLHYNENEAHSPEEYNINRGGKWV